MKRLSFQNLEKRENELRCEIEKKKNRMHQKIKDITSKHIKKKRQNMTKENFMYCQKIRKWQKRKKSIKGRTNRNQKNSKVEIISNIFLKINKNELSLIFKSKMIKQIKNIQL